MLRAITLIIEALLFVVMLFLAGKFINGANTGILIALIGISLPAIEYFRRLLPKKYTKKSKATLRRNQELQQIFNTEIIKRREHDLGKDAIIIDVLRKDEYPNSNETENPSWFEVSLEEIYQSGIHVGLGSNLLKVSSYGYRLPNPEKGETGEIKAMLMGEIPFDIIESVDIEGDHHHPYPHIFCRFLFNNRPYNRLFYAKTIMLEGRPWYKEIADYEVVKLNRVEEDWE